MRVQPDTDIQSEARKQINELSADLDRPSFLADAVKILEGWLAFIDQIQSQRDSIAQALKGFEAALRVLKPEQQTQIGLPPKATPPSPSRNLAARIRKAARQALPKAAQWLSSGQLANTVGLYDNELEVIDSSAVSAAMQSGAKNGEFIMRMQGGKRIWGLPEWRTEEDEIDVEI